MAESSRIFVARLAFRLSVIFRDAARRESRSETLGRTLEAINLDFGRTAVQSPYYWAEWYHNGRGAIRARPGHKLVYFRNPDNDPRIPNRRYPRRPEDVVRLTKQQFYAMLNDPNSGMVVTDRVGPAPGDPFMDRAARRFPARAGAEAHRAFDAWVRGALADVLQARVKSTFVV